MSSYPFFYNSVSGDRVYDADSFSDWLKKFFTTGVFNGEMLVTENGGMTVSVSGGYVNIEGKVQFFDASTLILSAASSNMFRRDAIMVERNDTDRDFYLKVVAGTNAGTADAAAAPAPIRTSTVYQIVIAHVFVAPGITAIHQADITDTRANSTLCGIVAGTVEQMDFSGFESQFQDWFDNVKDTLNEDAAGNLLDITEELSEDISELSDSIQEQITSLNDAIAIPQALGYGGLAEFYTNPNIEVDFQRIPANRSTKVPENGELVIPANETEYTKLYRLVFNAAFCANYTADKAMIVPSVRGIRSNGDAVIGQGYYHQSPLTKSTSDYRYENLTCEHFITQAPGEGPITFYGAIWTYNMSYVKHVQLAYYPVGIVET